MEHVSHGMSLKKETENRRDDDFQDIEGLMVHEVYIEFIALIIPPHLAVGHVPKRIYFEFQFFNFPLSKSDLSPLYLIQSPEDPTFFLLSEHVKFSNQKQNGMIFNFSVDLNQMVSPSEIKSFRDYLEHNELSVSIIDADTFVKYGSVDLELCYIQRSDGQSSVSIEHIAEITEDVGVLDSDVLDDSLSMTAAAAAKKGDLIIKMSNIGRRSEYPQLPTLLPVSSKESPSSPSSSQASQAPVGKGTNKIQREPTEKVIKSIIATSLKEEKANVFPNNSEVELSMSKKLSAIQQCRIKTKSDIIKEKLKNVVQSNEIMIKKEEGGVHGPWKESIIECGQKSREKTTDDIQHRVIKSQKCSPLDYEFTFYLSNLDESHYEVMLRRFIEMKMKSNSWKDLITLDDATVIWIGKKKGNNMEFRIPENIKSNDSNGLITLSNKPNHHPQT